MAYDTPILGYRVRTCNTLRLWKAEAVESFDFEAFNHGDYYRAVEDKMASENITKVLYPNDEMAQGKILRLQQQFFFVSCSLQDMVRLHLLLGRPLEAFHDTWAAQLNDTHPAIAVAELMRLLVDEHALLLGHGVGRSPSRRSGTRTTPSCPRRWRSGRSNCSAGCCPAISRSSTKSTAGSSTRSAQRFPGDEARVVRMSIIDEAGDRSVRMAHLAAVGSHTVNGVAALHSRLLTETVLRDFYDLWPEKFTNVTNGVTPRRFMAVSNPPLARLLTERVGDGWLKDLGRLRRLEPLADDAEFRRQWREVKLTAKRALAKLIEERAGVTVDPEALFDVQVKRLHEYKRQHLNVLHILALYLRLKRDPSADIPARVFLFGAKAAPGYFLAKRIIKLITATAAAVNGDPAVRDRLKVVFFPDFNVKNAQPIYPAADLSEQISTAGKEASGTGNMKFAMNGALTIGTLDGANVEIREEVGAENFFLFGLTAEQVAEVKARGYRPREYYERNADLREVLDFIASGALAHGDTQLFKPLVDNLLGNDPFLVLADFEAYVECQARVSRDVARPGGVDADVHPQRRPHGPVLVRPLDPRLLRAGVEGRARPAAGGERLSRPAAASRARPVLRSRSPTRRCRPHSDRRARPADAPPSAPDAREGPSAESARSRRPPASTRTGLSLNPGLPGPAPLYFFAQVEMPNGR